MNIRTFSTNELLVKQRREQIVRCSTRIFTKKGYNATNMRELARACNLSPGAIYHYFGSKEEILYLIIHNATSFQAERLERFAFSLEGLKPKDALAKLIKHFCEWHDENQDVTLFAYQESKNLPPEARQRIFDSEGRILSLFENILAKGKESGEFSVADPKLMAHDIVVICHSWALRRWFLRKYWTIDMYISEQTDAILKAVTGKPLELRG